MHEDFTRLMKLTDFVADSSTQLMESNPEIAHLMNDPAMLRQSMQIASNPELMQQQLRQQDQALNNIQSHPGYKIQTPMAR
jgi:hypothetical protein